MQAFNATLSSGSNIEKGKSINIVLGSRKEKLSTCKLKDAVKNMFFCPFSRKTRKENAFLFNACSAYNAFNTWNCLGSQDQIKQILSFLY